jgi:hypothetical protein
MAAKKGSAKKLAVVRGAVKAAVKASPASAKKLEALLSTIERRKARIVEDFYDIGVALKEILDKKLYLHAGFSSFGELLEKRKVMSRSQASKLIAIARAVPRAEAIEVGSEKAYELVRFTEQTPEPDTVGDLLATGVRGAKDKKPVDVKKLSSRDISAKRRELSKATTKRSPEEVAASRAVREAQASLRKAGYRVAVVARRDGKVWNAVVTLGVTELDQAVAALVRAAK